MDINVVGAGMQGMPSTQSSEQHSAPSQAEMTVGKTKESVDYIPSVQESDIIKAIENANKTICGANREAEFAVHQKTKQIMVKIVDKETKEVVKEIPSEKILDMVAKFYEVNGLFVDEKR